MTGLGREIVGCKEFNLAVDENSSYAEIIHAIGVLFPALIGVMIAPDGTSLLSSVILSRNGKELIMPDQMMSIPEHGDRLAFVFVIVGGIEKNRS